MDTFSSAAASFWRLLPRHLRSFCPKVVFNGAIVLEVASSRQVQSKPMSIESKHAYRFGYLKSEQWQTVRLEALVREKAKCQICKDESISNDAHHIWYPENIYDTTQQHLVILCRGCHEFIRSMVPECKTNIEEEGMAHWQKFKNAITVWRLTKSNIFVEGNAEGIQGVPRALREQLVKVTTELKLLKSNPMIHKKMSLEDESKYVFTVMKKWAASHLHSLQQGDLPIAESDYQI